MSRVKMGEELGLSKQSVLNIIDSLVLKGFLIKDDETSFLRTSRAWNILYFTTGKESLPPVNNLQDAGKESLPTTGKESLPNNNNLDINNDIYKAFAFFDDTFLITWKEYLKMRVAKKQKATPAAEKLALHKIEEFSKGDKKRAIKIVEQSILNSWQGIFDLRVEFQNQQSQLTLTGEVSSPRGASL